MHHALEVEEILLNIFGQCCPPPRFKNRHSPGSNSSAAADLVALARTCRLFKEPALDILWSELDDLSPLSRCLPEVSYQISPGHLKLYSFSRPLQRADWDILRSYARRVWSIRDFRGGLDWDSVETFLNPPIADPLFPNLRYLHCKYANESMPLLHLPLPSLISLDIEFWLKEDLYIFQDTLESFPKFSPNIRRFSIRLRRPEVTFSKIVSDYICCWPNLQIVVCPEIALDVVALAQLSRMSALTRLAFTLSATLPDQIASSDSPLSLSNLHDLKLHSGFLIAISLFLSRIRLPAITDFTASIYNRPSKQDVASFLAAVQTSSVGHTIQGLRLVQKYTSSGARGSEGLRLLLALDDLRPCMAFSNLRRVAFNIDWEVGLTDSQLLELASAWPHLEHLLINEEWGWQTPGGITPDGLMRLLQTCRSLSQLALAVDTRGYTTLPPSRWSASLGWTLPRTFSIDVLDSVIEVESVTAMAAFFAGIAPCFNFSFRAWVGPVMIGHPNFEVYEECWSLVYALANDAVRRRCWTSSGDCFPEFVNF